MSDAHTNVEALQLRSQLAALEQLLEVYEQTAIAQAEKLEHVVAQERKHAQEQSRLMRQQDVLLHISQAIQAIRQPSDFGRVAQALHGALREIGLDFYALAIHRLIDRDTQTFESYEVWLSGDTGRLVRPLPNVYRMWQAGKATYRPDLDANAGGASPEDIEKLRRRHGVPIRCILDVPHARGTLALLSVKQDGFTEPEIEFVRQVAGVLSVGMARVEDQESLAQERDRAQNYLDVAGVMIVALDAHGRVTLINRKGCDILGYPEREIVGRNWIEGFLPERYREQVRAVFSRLMAGEVEPVEHFENPVVVRGGEERLIAWHNSVIKDADGRVVGTLGSGEDITERRQAELALREREETFRAMTGSAQDAIIMMDDDGRISYWNEAAAKAFGYAREEALGQELHAFLAPERFYDAHRKGFAVFKATGEGAAVGKTLELAGVKKDGTEFPFELSLASVKLKGAWHAVGIVRDITDRKRMEEMVREREERIRAILDGSPDGIGVADIHTRRFMYVNPALCSMLGYDADELVGAGIDKIHPAAQLGHVISEFEAQARGEKILAADIPLLRKDGSIIYSDVSATTASVDGRECNIGFVRDITGQKQMEAALRRAERDRVLVETAGAAAHEINQPLAVVSGLAQILLGTTTEDDPRREDFRAIHEGCRRIEGILRQMEQTRQYTAKPYVGDAKIVEFGPSAKEGWGADSYGGNDSSR